MVQVVEHQTPEPPRKKVHLNYEMDHVKAGKNCFPSIVCKCSSFLSYNSSSEQSMHPSISNEGN
jgi:hypothetical protein